MIITAIETILVDAFPNLCYVHIHTDAGLIGLGETFFGPEAVAAHLHATAAPMLLGQDPFRIERHWHNLYAGPAPPSIGARAPAVSAVHLRSLGHPGPAAGLPPS